MRYLRRVQVAPNGHAHARKRPLLDKGIKYFHEPCRSMFNFTIKRRHLPPYAENPFTALELDRIPLENSKPVAIFTPNQARAILAACDDWQFPLFISLMPAGAWVLDQGSTRQAAALARASAQWAPTWLGEMLRTAVPRFSAV